jgi:hypothetical protein
VLFEDDGRKQGGFQTMRTPVLDDTAKASQRGASTRFVVIGQTIQEALNR